MNILIPILSFTKAGGMRVLTKLANNWVKQGHKVTIVVGSTYAQPYYPVDSNVDVVYTEGENSKNGHWLKGIVRLYKYLRINSSGFDAVIANQHLTAYPVIMASKTNNFYYIQAYEPEFRSANKGILLSNMKYFIAWITYFFPMTRVVNADIYKSFKNLKANDVVNPGLDTKTFCQVKSSERIRFTVGCIGREQIWKGAEDVGLAVKIVHDQGFSEVDLKVAFHKINSYENYELVIPDGDENLAKFYQSLDVLIAPGHIQLGAVHYPVLEAMACKTPVITTGYAPATHDNAFIVPVQSPKDIADAIIHIYKNGAEEKVNKAYEDVLDFSWETVSTKFIDIISKKAKPHNLNR